MEAQLALHASASGLLEDWVGVVVLEVRELVVGLVGTAGEDGEGRALAGGLGLARGGGPAGGAREGLVGSVEEHVEVVVAGRRDV